jgi:hypothetical protein
MKLINTLLTIAITVMVAALAMQGRFELATLAFVAGGAVTFGLNHTPQNRAAGACFANTLTNLIPDFYVAMDVVSREMVGMIPAVQRDARADRCALNATMRSPVSPINSAVGNITPAMSIPSAADQSIGNTTFTIQKSRFAPFSWTGEEQGGVDTGAGFLSIQQDQIAQALRGLTNEVENDLCDYGALGASRAYGTAGTTPFGTAGDLSDAAQLAKILDDNGAPMSDRHCVLGSTAIATMRGKQSSLFKVNEAGDSSFLRQGLLGDLFGFGFRGSAQINNATKGTGASYQLSAALAVGDTTVNVDTGSGTILAGDVVTISNHKYVVATALSGGSFTVAAPGIQEVVADNTAITVNNTSQRNLGFTRNSILLGTRLPALPKEGDLATDREIITDPRSGLVFELAVYPGFRMVTYHVSIAWGVSVMKPEHLAVLLG